MPSDVIHDAPRVSAYAETDSTAALADAIDLLNEERDIAIQRSTVYQQNRRHYHSGRVRSRSFNEGDLVLRLKQKSHHKLSPPWEGPFVIAEVLSNGAYRLKDMKTDVVYTNPWNIAQLRHFYT